MPMSVFQRGGTYIGVFDLFQLVLQVLGQLVRPLDGSPLIGQAQGGVQDMGGRHGDGQ